MFQLSVVEATGDYATPHSLNVDGTSKSISPNLDERMFSPIMPAAGLWSSAREMALLTQTLLAGGVAPNGARIVSEETLYHLWDERTALNANSSMAPPGAKGYGLGWFVGEIQGRPFVGHTGSTIGFYSELMLVPEADFGFVILTNGASAPYLPFAVQQRVFELVFNAPETAAEDVERVSASSSAAQAAMQARLTSVDADSVKPFLGLYDNSDLGAIELRLEGERLILDWGEANAELLQLRDKAAGGHAYVLVGGAPIGGVLRFNKDASGTRRLVLGGLVEHLGPSSYVFVPIES